MFKQNSKFLLFLLLAFLIGSIGAIGQSFILQHELIDCYPYKVINGHFYSRIANIGIYFAPVTAILCGILFGLRKFWLATAIPVVLCPLLFSAVFLVYSYIKTEENFGWHFDGKTSETAALDFILYTITLSFLGGIISGICSFVLIRFSKVNKLP